MDENLGTILSLANTFKLKEATRKPELFNFYWSVGVPNNKSTLNKLSRILFVLDVLPNGSLLCIDLLYLGGQPRKKLIDILKKYHKVKFDNVQEYVDLRTELLSHMSTSLKSQAIRSLAIKSIYKVWELPVDKVSDISDSLGDLVSYIKKY